MFLYITQTEKCFPTLNTPSTFKIAYHCNILTFDPAVNRRIAASGRRYQDITLTVDGLNSV